MTPSSRSTLERWQVPLDLSSYDQTPTLSQSEREALLLCDIRLSRALTPWRKDTQSALERLMRPIWDALQAAHAHPRRCRRTVNGLVREMHRRQSSYWAWQPQDWYEVLQSSFPIREQQKAGVVDLMAVAYLLGGLRQFRDCGRVHHTVLAKRLFGMDYVEAAFQQVFQELQRWVTKKRIPRLSAIP